MLNVLFKINKILTSFPYYYYYYFISKFYFILLKTLLGSISLVVHAARQLSCHALCPVRKSLQFIR
jgi:hypothetical protein